MTKLPSISVIFPTFNRSEVVEKTIRHIAAQDYPAESIEILVCDNSSDDTPEMVKRVAEEIKPSLRLIASEERLPAVKRNQGLLQAEGDIALFLNDDVWLREDALGAHAKAHGDHDGPVAVLGHVEQSEKMPSTPFIDWYRPFAYDELTGRNAGALSYRYFWSMNLSLPRKVMLDRRLVFHEDWANIGHEDVELGYRWTKAGYPIVYEPDAWGEHYHPHDLDSACRLQYSVGRGLRDLAVLIPDPSLLERYGVFTFSNSPKAMARAAVRKTLFNKWTVPALQRRFSGIGRRSRLAEWSYWKIMLHHTERGWKEQSPRFPLSVPTMPGGGV